MHDHAFTQTGAKADSWVITVGAGASKFSVLDKKFSSVPYSGFGWKTVACVQYERGKAFHELAAGYSNGYLKTDIKPMNDLDQIYFDAGYLNLYDLSRSGEKRFTCKAGGSIHFLYAQRTYNNFINNNISFEFAASLSGVLQVSYAFRNRFAGFSISDRLMVPFISSIVQPAFDAKELPGGINNSGSGGSGFFHSNYIASFPSFTRVKNYLRLDKIFSSRHKISFAYIWDYYQFLRQREVLQASHNFGLTYTFILL